MPVLARRVLPRVLIVALVALVVVVALSGSNPYRLTLLMNDTSGVSTGVQVRIGGVPVGKVTSLGVNRAGLVRVGLEIARDRGPVGRDATASIQSLNLLGQKTVVLDKGDVADPLPSGGVIPLNRVSVSTDLDQVLNVLDPDTRARLDLMLDETAAAVAGRRNDITQLLGYLPPDVRKATQLLDELVANNDTLEDLVTSSDTFVSTVTAKRSNLVRMVRGFGDAATTFAQRRTQLAQTIAAAPPMLAELQKFLGKLDGLTVPLGPAAQDIQATAPVLDETLAQLAPFRQAADPVLAKAGAVAPLLTSLATGATPVLQKAEPTAQLLTEFSNALTPISDILNHSANNIISTADNWGRAVEVRDKLGHLFRGEASLSPSYLDAILAHLLGTSTTTSGSSAHRRAAAPRVTKRSAPKVAPASPVPGSPPSTPSSGAPPLLGGVGNLLGGVGNLLGGLLGTGSAGSGAPATSASPQSTGQHLSSLLGYLLKP
jgi:phospholipid/cholesterol/gamma-HCH transport system substrate-binding protein